MFGDPEPFVMVDGGISPRWETKILTTVQVPFEMRYYVGLDPDIYRLVRVVRCHVALAWEVADMFRQIHEAGLKDTIKNFAGFYNWRRQRKGRKLSAHAWGIAFDINSIEDPQGDVEIDIEPALVELLERRGWMWGGRFGGDRVDAMHFQWCKGY